MFELLLPCIVLTASPQANAIPSSNTVEHGYRPVVELRPAVGVHGEQFGGSLSAEGDTLVVGAPPRTTIPWLNGSVRVFERGASGWEQVARITAPPSVGMEIDYLFGWSVELRGDRLAVGWPGRDSRYQASVMIYERNYGGPNAWGLTQRIDSPSYRPFSRFGVDLEWDRDELVVGASGYPDNTNGYHVGYVQTFAKVAAGGELFAKTDELASPTLNPWGPCGDSFGYSFALDGDRMLVSAPVSFPMACFSSPWSTAYTFTRTPGGWLLEQELEPDGFPDNYGHNVALRGELAAVTYLSSGWGYVRVFRRIGSSWNEVADRAFGPVPSFFGQGSFSGPAVNLSLSPKEIAVGVPASGDHGLVRLFRRDNGGPDNWGPAGVLEPWNGIDDDHFGATVERAGNTLFVGAPGRVGEVNSPGTVYVFEALAASATPSQH